MNVIARFSAVCAGVTVLSWGAVPAAAGEAPKKEEAVKKGPAKIEPLPEEEKAKLLAAETVEQKALREELKNAGRVVFDANGDGVSRIYIMNADGSDVKCLTPAPAPASQYPHLSPDGKKIVFWRDGQAKNVWEKLPADPSLPLTDPKRPKGRIIFMADAGGDNPAAVPVAQGIFPHWSWDGRKIIYTISPQVGGPTAILDVENKKEVVLPSPNVNGYHPLFLPDGKRILLVGKGSPCFELNDEGLGLKEGGKVLLLAGMSGCNFEVSADGKWLAWVIDTVGDTGGWLCCAEFPPEGQKVAVQKLPLGWDPKSVNYFPDFSPDGKYLVYVHADNQGGQSWKLTRGQELYVTRFPKCDVTVRVTWNGAANRHPNWRK